MTTLPTTVTADDWVHPNSRHVAHVCINGRARPYPSLLCSCCRSGDKIKELSISDLVEDYNDHTELALMQQE